MHLQAPRTAVRLLPKGAWSREIGRTRGWRHSKLHAVCDDNPVVLRGTTGRVSESLGADLVLPDLPPTVKVLMDDKSYDRNR